MTTGESGGPAAAGIGTAAGTDGGSSGVGSGLPLLRDDMDLDSELLVHQNQVLGAGATGFVFGGTYKVSVTWHQACILVYIYIWWCHGTCLMC